MHELSIARSIVETVTQSVAEEDLGKVRSVNIRIGDLAGVLAGSLEFCYQVLTADTLLSESFLRIERVPFQIECQECGRSSISERGFAVCPLCGSGRTKLLSGDELDIVGIELNETPETAHERAND